ncbi:TetR-like C-terminal domain-containing protein [Bdellovibrio sp. 22V]|uniref:TetR-like C-terminal domain-containing protein n=1 Tax=Bdellovibrio TaxID=958 RepID=UPI0025432A94|nr:TetR-like C-terminal domain-containing protein [Bdellovibrio sp. 22V]WII72643.1 TetR-like C-terminal domain-containing protein [Bdellovibrio sp. 22V]
MFHSELRRADEQRQELHDAGEKAFLPLVEILGEGIKNGTFKKEDPVMVARSVWSSVHGFSILLLDGQFQSLTSKNAVSEAVDLHLAFIERAVLK